jgi:hypothetical protein
MTSQNQSTPHIEADELLSYFEARFSDARAAVIEEHLADCVHCTQLAREVHAFHLLWSWTAETHQEAVLREALVGALDVAGSTAAGSQWQSRLVHWRHRWTGFAETAARVVIETSAQAARSVATGLDALTRPGSAWHLAPVAATAAVRGGAPPDSGTTLLTAEAANQARVRVAVEAGESGRVVVRLDGLSPNTQHPLVVLVVKTQTAQPRVLVAETERLPGTDSLIARFERLSAGDYLLAVEPIAQD